jgi:hypothetical protein
MSKHVAVLLGATAVLMVWMPVMAQSVSIQEDVIEICHRVVDAEKSNDEESSLRGQCILATAAYLDNLSTSSAPPFDQPIADLVVALAELLYVPDCPPESEIPQAIALANARVSDPDQQEQIQLIVLAADSCDLGVTGSLGPPNTFAPATLISGTSASLN